MGGLGEVGMNCMALETAGELLIIDCGTNFPGDDYGVDVVHPDFSWLHDNWHRVCGVFLTHGHEDHIGGLPYLLKERSKPLYGPAHALRLVTKRFVEHGLEEQRRDFREVNTRRSYRVGPFEVEPVRVSHSIIEATALSITTEAGRVVHSGDFKFDPAPADGECTDEERLRALGDEGIDLLLSDSTNVDTPGTSGSETDVEAALDQVVKAARRRVFVALFASNVQRLISLGRIAQRRGRRLCLLGRSLVTHVDVARQLGYLDWPPDLLLPPERLSSYPKAEVLALATGTQAEPAAAMAKLARGEHRFAEIDPGDTVVFSSRIIPGCDRAVVDMMGQLMRRGALVHSRWTDPVHVSGHACRDEQRRMLELLRPRCFVPVHGTLHHLRRHADLARAEEVPSVEVIENGQSIILQDGTLRRGEDVYAGKVHVGLGGRELSLDVLGRRRDLGRSGIVSVGILCSNDGKLNHPPRLQAMGVPFLEQEGIANQLVDGLTTEWRSLRRAAATARTRQDGEGGRGPNSGSPRSSERAWAYGARFVSVQSGALELQVERFVQRWADSRYGLRPMVAVHILHTQES